MISLRKKVVNKLVVNWMASLLSVVILLSIVAAPALALVAANSVNSSSIVDRSIRTRDIKRNAINSSRIRNHTIRKEDIHSGSINKYKLTSGSVNTYKILDGSILNRDIANGAVNSSKINDGSVVNADISAGAAISDSKISYDTTKTGHLSIPPSAFAPETQSNSYMQKDGFYLYTTAAGIQGFFAPVQLPHGAKVTKVTFEVYDNHGTYSLTCQLRRRSASGGTTSLQSLASRGTSAASAIGSWQNLEDTSIVAGRDVVDNINYSYFLEAEFSGNSINVRAGRVLIEYTHTSPGS